MPEQHILNMQKIIGLLKRHLDTLIQIYKKVDGDRKLDLVIESCDIG